MAKKTSCTNDNLHKAKNVKNDEFYTKLSDIENELRNYKHHFNGKVVLCNCDESEHTNFYKYFALNFMVLNLKKLICVGYRINRVAEVHVLERVSDNRVNEYNTPLKGHGDFRDQESIEFLKESDIVVTNPPFSLFREFMDLLIQYDKKFLVIGNFNAVKYKNIFPLIKDNKLWIGTRPFGGAISMIFNVPDEKQLIESGKHYIMFNGKAMAQIPATWFTNLYHAKQKPLVLSKTYHGNESMYPKYDNADVINIDRKTNIPIDYYGVMGIPITFIDRYNKNYFEILGMDKDFTNDGNGAILKGRHLYGRIFIRRLVQ